MKIKSLDHHSTTPHHNSPAKGSGLDESAKGSHRNSGGAKHSSAASKPENYSLSLRPGTSSATKTDKPTNKKASDNSDSAFEFAKGLFGRGRNPLSGIFRKPPLPGPLGDLPLPHQVIPAPGEIIDTVQETIVNGSIPKPGLSAGDMKKIRDSLSLVDRRIGQVKKEIDRATDARGKAPLILVERLRRLEERAEQLTNQLPKPNVPGTR